VSAPIVGPLVIGSPAAVVVGALAVSAMPSVADDASAVVHTLNSASAAHPVIDVHPVSLDRADLAILAKGRASAVLHRNCLCSRRLVTIRCACTAAIVGAGIAAPVIRIIRSSAIIRVAGATSVVVGVGASAIVGVGSTTVVRVVSAPVRSRAVARIGSRAAIVCARRSGPILACSPWAAVI
jgi:hypothetical protein